MKKSLDTFHFRDALKASMDLARIGNKYLADSEPWKLAKTDVPRMETILNLSLQIVANLGIAFEPFLPFSAKKIRSFVCQKQCAWDNLGNMTILPDGLALETPSLLFEKIENEIIEQQSGKLTQK
jgi:methionyl-tRNA synthetase